MHCGNLVMQVIREYMKSRNQVMEVIKEQVPVSLCLRAADQSSHFASTPDLILEVWTARGELLI